MKALLVDTHTLLWWRTNESRLGASALAAIEDATVPVFFSVASVWEIAIKRAKGKLQVPDRLLETMQQRGFAELPVRAHHAILAGALPRHHGDPFDRMIVAQAECEELTVVTRDPRIGAYGVPVLW
ncbi:MAG TPA: type II toxin-antitoxin system VapC family toxin [Solirubrobacteraceae bacterium]|nr:type II toxin-antitoxin system VapC family toxin [Solirubrobacteraceae bacterium]